MRLQNAERCLLLLAFIASSMVSESPAETNAAARSAPMVNRAWRVEDGLPHNGVTAILQSRNGYLWLGTQNGLARFDGLHFTTFGLPQGLPNLSIYTMIEDRQGALWIGTEGGLSRFHHGRFQNWTRADGLAGNYVTSLAEDGAGGIWIGTTLGLSRWDGAAFTQATVSAARTNVYIRALTTDAQGRVVVATLHQGLFHWMGERMEALPGPPGIPQVDAYCLRMDSQQRLWAGLSWWLIKDGVSLLCLESNMWRRFSASDGLPNTANAYLTCLGEAADGTLWAGSLDEGIYSLREGRFASIRRSDGLADEGVIAVLPDRNQNLWVGTRAGGLQRFSPRRVISHPVLEDGSERLPTTLAQTADGRLWVGTSGRGLFEWRGDTFDQLPRGLPLTGPKQVEAMLTSRDGGLWWGAGPALYKRTGNRLTAGFDEERRLAGDRVISLCEARDSSLWVGTLNGRLHVWREGKFSTFNQGLAHGPVTAIAETPDGTLWAGTLGGGLNRIRGGTITVLTTRDGLESNLIRTLFVDRDGELWIGTQGGGLSCWRSNRLHTFTTRHGLVDSSVVQILEDDAGFLWLGSYHGLMRLSKADLGKMAAGQLRRLNPLVLDHSDGLLSEQCVAGPAACLKTAAGRLCFATARGIAVLESGFTPARSERPVVLIEDVLADGTSLPGSPAAYGSATDGLRAPAGTGRLTFHYTGLCFDAPEKVRFRCLLDGIDPDWVEVGADRFVTYTHVPPGQYRFRVIACNRDGEWDDTGASLAFTVLPHFWQTWWFLGVTGLAGLGTLAAAIRYAERRRYHRRLRRLEMERAMERERSRIARDMHDEIGARLTQITLINAMTSRRPENAAEVRAQSGKIATATRELTRSLDEIVWAVRPQNDNLESLIEYLGNATRDLCDGSNVRCWFTTPDQVPPIEVTATVRHNLVLACREAVNNVLKHSGATELRMRVRLEDNSLTVSINDNGHGFNVAQTETKRSGLANMRQRMAECDGTCEITSATSGGTDVRLHLPLSASAPGTPNSGNRRFATGGIA
jgi:ligand-binding sensor domain-containing protein/signal transduction histidine kinase